MAGGQRTTTVYLDTEWIKEPKPTPNIRKSSPLDLLHGMRQHAARKGIAIVLKLAPY
jgi:hypothetical protein